MSMEKIFELEKLVDSLKQENEKFSGDNNYLHKKIQSMQSENDKLHR